MMFREPVQLNDLRNRFESIFAESKQSDLSDKYLYVPTFKLIEGLERQGFQIVGAKQSRSRTVDAREHAKHVVYLSHPEILDKAQMSVGEERPMLALTNSHNGTSALAFDTAFFRLVCSNGLLMPSSAVNSARVVHKIGMQGEVIDAAYKVVASMPAQVALVSSLKGIQLNQSEKMLLATSAARMAFEESELELNRSVGNAIEDKLLHPRRHADVGDDLWKTFNVIQENIIKGGLRVVRENEETKRRSIAKTRAVGSIDRDAKLNRELMALATGLAQLKTA